MKIDLIFFDFDGTLADSIPAAVGSIQYMLNKLGLPYRTAEEINRHVGFGEEPLVSGSIGTKDLSIIKKAMDIYFENYEKEGFNKVSLYLHVKECLEALKGKKMIIVSNKKHSFIGHLLKKFGLEEYFSEFLGGDTVPCLKPDPCAINDLIKKYNIPKDRVLFVGDMTVDVETGKNAGIHTCAVTYGFDPVEKLKSAKPDFLIDDILKLKDIVD
ncbi:HAD-IA family hydrolase [Candidatus Saganbacteria bacterium]|nr:HAD-IA family hydrolase [Candidatus Saganbacteria bacterium]